MRSRISEEALAVTRKHLDMMHVEYRYYMNNGVGEIPSTGTVANYTQVSGRTNRTSDFTAMIGVKLASLSPEKVESLRWIECAWRVFMRGSVIGLNREKQTLPHRRRLATISYVLYYRAFLGYTLQRIADMGMPHGGTVSKQRVFDYWRGAIVEVAREAQKAGLL